ncbi:MAG: S8 family serine peptidase [Anaerolineae bacterium]
MERLARLGNGFVSSTGGVQSSSKGSGRRVGPWRLAWVLALCLLAGLFGGALVTLATAPIALALAVGAIGGLALLRSPILGLLSVIGVVILLPFAAVPLGVGFNPTFLNLALLATITVWMLRVALGQERWLVFPAVAPAILAFMLMAIFAFVLGLGHATLTPSIARHFAELLLAIAFSLVLVNLLQTEEQLTLVTKAVILAGAVAAFIGVFLYVLPDDLALRLLSPLRYLEYNVGLRYIRDDPSLPERAVGTSVDPNAFGGLLILVTALTLAQLFSNQPLLPKAVIASIALMMGVCLTLTFSRSAMVGLVVALSIIALLRYRRLLVWMAVAGAIFVVLPQTQGYISHFIAGVQGQDLATKMRFGEYSDALRLIQRHPWFGVGFAGVPEIDIYLGVSSMYLLLAENMGLVGLLVFLLMMSLFFLHLWREWHTMENPRLRPIVLGLGAGLAGAIVSGVFDHYFVNINFPHAVTLFWLFVGLGLAATNVQGRQGEGETGRRGDKERGRQGDLRFAYAFHSYQRSPCHLVTLSPCLKGSRAPLLLLALVLPLLLLGASLAGGVYVARADSDRTIPQYAIRNTQYATPNTQYPVSNLQSPISNRPAILRKIEPDLLKAALEQRETPRRFLVHLRQPDLDLAALQSLPAPARRRAIVDRLQETAATSQQAVRAYLSKAQTDGRVVEYKSFWIFNGLAVTGDFSTLIELASRPEVEMIRADRKHWLPEPDQVPGTYTATPGEGLEWGLERVRAQMVWQALGVDGSGVVVASMDSGVDWLHPDLQSAYRGYDDKGLPAHVGNWYSVTDEGYVYPGDGNGHGTHTTATMVGQNGVGVAPGAKWIAVKVFHNQGYTFDSWIHDAFQWVMAPAGDPERAPDVVNGSWSSDIPDDESLREDIKRLRTAGIVPVFAIGNNGPEPDSLGSPASYPEVLAVGALDQDGEVANFSGRGPSPWGETKPEVVAPGTGVRSAVPGGGRQAWNGTSMAAPHVSGIVALMRQADPDLSPDKIEEILKSTAATMGQTVPNNDIGWGLVDAYRAVANIMNVGTLHGRVKRAVDGEPIAGAQVSVSRREGGVFVHTTTNVEGYYELTLPPGPYDLLVTAFAYQPAAVQGFRISKDARMARDISLVLQPFGDLSGQVTDEATGGPLAAEINVVGTPVSALTGPPPGQYAMRLPPGEYELEVVSKGHRIGHASVSITVDQLTRQDFKLPAAPSILLVDSGAWYYGSQGRFFTEALNDLDYTYDIWRIKNLERDLPTAKALSAYDITIWSSPRDAPGLIGASSAITNYLEAGGRLLLTGQDVGYWDGGGSRDFFAPYYRDYLRAVYVKDDSGYRKAYGATGTDFEDLRLALGRADSARNQRFPDQIAARDSESVQVAFYYGDPDTNSDGLLPAGLVVVGQCLPYRVVYLAFGFEGVETAAARSEVLARAIQSLTAPLPTLGVRVAADPSMGAGQHPSWKIVPAGSTAEHIVKVRNTGRRTDIFHLSLQAGDWEASLWNGDFGEPLAQPIRIASCEAITVGVKVGVPPGTPRHTADQVTLTAVLDSRLNGEPVSDEVTLTTKTPAGILLVDDDRWINVEEYYEVTLEGLGIGYDDWPVGWNTGEALGSPPSDTLDLYPVVIWFTGYDWFQTLTPDQELTLAEYLASGGRLLLSSQDYLYTNGLKTFAHDYLGVVTYTEDITSTLITGEAGNAIGDGLGPFELEYPFPNHSDAIEPVDDASVVFRGNRNRPVAVSYAPGVARSGDRPQPAFKSVFFAFPFEAFSRPVADIVMGRVLDWLSPLHASSVAFDRAVAAEGDELAVIIVLRNDGQSSASKAKVRAFLPSQAEYVVGSLRGADYDPIARVMRWQTSVPAGEEVTVDYRIQLALSVPDATTVVHRVDIEDEGGLKLQRYAAVRVDAPDLSESEKSVSHMRAGLGDVLTYTVTLQNRGTADGSVMSLQDELPPQLEFIEGSLSASSGRATSDGQHIIWEGRVPRDRPPVSIHYRARVIGYGVITNVAQVNDGTGITTVHAATTLVPTELYLPLLVWLEAR